MAAIAPQTTIAQSTTPVMRQYLAAKRQHPEALLLFRLGDFYELFYEDAKTAAAALDITLTSRGTNKEKGTPIPMCGVPWHAAESYIAKLIQQGHKVALCEQMPAPAADGSKADTLMRREITRVLTPGTAAFAVPEADNRFLAAIVRSPDGASVGWAVVDVSTGEFRATEFAADAAAARLAEEMAQWRPREILYAASDLPLFEGQRAESEAALTPLEPYILEASFAHGVLESHFGVLSLEGFGLTARPWAAAAAGAIVHYVKETQRSALAHIDRLGYYERQQGLVIDAVSARNLELVEPQFQGAEATTLRSVLDATATPMGKRLLRQWILRPAADLGIITARLDAVAALVSAWSLAQTLRTTLAGIQDLERLLARVALDTALPRDMLALGASLARIPMLAGSGAGTPGRATRLRELIAALDPCERLHTAITAQIVDTPPATLAEGGYIRAGVDPTLDELRQLAHGAKAAIAAIETRERERTTIISLKVRFNNVFGYYIEISKANLKHVPPDYERKQTLVNAERFTTPELKDLERKILSAEEQARALELDLFLCLRRQAAEHARPIRQNAAAIAELDVLANFAHLARERHYCRPQMAAAGGMEILEGRHAVIERGGDGTSEPFVPNSLALDPEAQRLLLVTGPNMGGKSTYLRQAALIALMAHMGSFVPASSARLPVMDRIFTRIGASDNLARGRSTFMVEMTEAAVILNQATERSLVILDEIGRGTATYDGLALAWAMVEYLHDHTRALTLFATHYHELTSLAQALPALRNAQVAVRESPQGIVFLRKVEAGEASRSYGIEVARLAGLPRAVIERARIVLGEHERAAAANGASAAAMQLTLFTPQAQRLADRLAAVDLDALSPLEALNLLAELKHGL
ncbi:MAG: DNA mismatch repair protein MutS [Terriglobales bacterium]